LTGAVQVSFDPPDRPVLHQFDVAVPAPTDATTDDQYIATRIVDFRGRNELTMVDTAFLDAAGCAADPNHCRVITDPSAFEGLTIGGTFGLLRAKECIAYLVGWMSTGDRFAPGGYVGSSLYAPVLPFALQPSLAFRFEVPVPCNTPANVQLFDSGDSV